MLRDEPPPSGAKVTLSDVLTSPGECSSSFGPGIWTGLIVASICWMLRGIGVVYHLFQYWEMRSFYQTALHIGRFYQLNFVHHLTHFLNSICR